MRTTAQIKRYKKRRRVVTADSLVGDIRIVIDQSPAEEAGGERHVTMLYWQIGKLIRDGLKAIEERNRRAAVLEDVARQIHAAYGDDFKPSRIRLMVEFGNCFSDARAASLLAQNLTWQHFRHIIPLCGPLKRNFYAEMSRIEHWGSKELGRQIRDMLFERAVKSGERAGKTAARVLSALKSDEAALSEFVYDDPDTIDL